MAKMGKQEKDYLVNKMRSEALKAKNEYAKATPIAHAEDTIIEVLTKAGFTITDKYYACRGINLPLTDELEANKIKVADFCAKVDRAFADAQDKVYLGGDDAIAMLRDFQNALKELV